MNEQLRDKLVEDLQKSGFYSEMRAIHTCTAAQWECHGSFTYFDKDEQATRECDFEAVREWFELAEHGESIQVTARLLGQVKKAEIPWIVFMDRQLDHPRFQAALDNIIVTNESEQERFTNVLRRRVPTWIGTGIHEAFKRPTESSRWYSAFVSACKAAESAFDTTIATPRPGKHFEWIKPVVVLDGLLVSAELSAEGKVILKETGEASFAFEYRSDAYERPRYLLDVVTLDSFPRYLASVTERMHEIMNTLRS